MVSVYPNPPPGQEFPNHFCGYYKGGDLITMNTSADENEYFLDWNAGSGVDDSNKKVRKPYTITKSRESWSEQEHDKFLEALQLFDRDWKKIEAFVGSKTVIQIRSHAQKYFLKVQKNGTSEHVPPPRPKRKAAHPYPHKAPKNAALLQPGNVVRQDSTALPRNSISSTPLSPWATNIAPMGSVSDGRKDDLGTARATTHNYSSSSNESTPRVSKYNKTNYLAKEKRCKEVRVMPDFAQVYRFIGNMFDPSASDHLEQLKQMDPINIETALMLMKNLSENLVSPEFENHKEVLLSQNACIKEDGRGKTICSG